MKTFFLILFVATISSLNFEKKERIEGPKIAKTKMAPEKGTKINFAPFSWQTKWFKKDLNSRAYLSGQEGC